jgi:alpha-tubulin suppressor-like RCC1 family protein
MKTPRSARIVHSLWMLALLAFPGCDSTKPPTAAQLAFVVQPGNATAGVAIAPALQVAIQDAKGNTMTTSTAEVTLALGGNSGTATLNGTKTVAAVGGIATFAGLTIEKAATGYTLVATSTGLTDATSAVFAVSAGPLAKLAIATQPTSSVAGVPFDPVVAVTATDALDNAVSTSITLSITAATAIGGASISGTTTVATTNGVAAFTGISIQRAGTGYVLQAAATGAPTVTTNAIDIAPAAAAKLAFVQSPSNGEAMTLLTPIPKVSVQDTYSNVVTSSTAGITLDLSTVPAGLSVGTLRGTTTVNAVAGVATFDNVRLDRPGHNFILRSTAGTLTGVSTVTFAMDIRFDTVVVGGTATGSHSCSIATSRYVFCWGANQFGQLADGGTAQRASPVAVTSTLTFATVTAGSNHTCALTPQGAAYCWGSNQYGQLGDGSTTQRTTPTLVSGSLVFESLDAADTYTCGVVLGANGGPAYCWGHNAFGQLGDGTTTDRIVPTAVAGGLTVKNISADSSHTCAVVILNGQEGFCWGDNGNGQLGDATTTQRLVPTKITGNRQWNYVVVGGLHSCGVGDALYCWGSNSNGQQGNGNAGTTTSTPTLVTNVNPFWLSLGWYYTCINGSVNGATTSQVHCWGHNGNGQLGDGSTTDRNVPVQAGTNLFRMDAARYHTCATNASKQGFCWGSNANGQLGDGTQTDRLLPTRVAP